MVYVVVNLVGLVATVAAGDGVRFVRPNLFDPILLRVNAQPAILTAEYTNSGGVSDACGNGGRALENRHQ